jgi:hypothetical protein
MSQKKKKRKAQSESGSAVESARPARKSPSGPRWPTGYLVLAFAIGLALGAALAGAYSARRSGDAAAPAATFQRPGGGTAPGSPAAGSPATGSGTDPYGRSAADEHYGHDHP